LRLRPHGSASPLASSLENFCRYYGPNGQAHSFEKLALVRMRAVAGSTALGARLERLRDEFIYSVKSVDIQELRAIRQKQFKEKSAGSKPVYVIGSHWSHPAQGQSYPSDSTAALAKALSDNNIHSTDRIILLADTNDSFPDKPTPDSVLMNAILRGKAKHVQGTGPRHTCCCSDPPQGDVSFPFKTDRIISNFGRGDNVQIPELTEIFGSIAQRPPKNPLLGSCVFGEMHKPVFWKLHLK